MLVPLTVAMTFPTLNHLLIIFLALLLFRVSQISIQTIAISDLGETLMILGFDASMISLKMWLFLRMHSISLEEMCVFDVVATTCQNGTRSMLTSAKLSVGYLVVEITRKLDKESLLY